MAYPTPRCAGCAHYPHDGAVCGATDESGRNGVTCDCVACSRCGHRHIAGAACPWKITDTATCGCRGPKATDGVTTPVDNGLRPNIAQGILDLIEGHVVAGTLGTLPPVALGGDELRWRVVRLIVDMALRHGSLADLPLLTYLGVPVPYHLLPNWDQLEANWWRIGVRAATDNGEDSDV